MWVGLFSQAASNRPRINGHKLCLGRCGWGITKIFLERLLRNWNRGSRKVEESPYMEVFLKRVDEAQRDVF